MKRTLLLTASAIALAVPTGVLAHGPSGHEDTEFGRPGDAGKFSRIIQVFMRDEPGKMTFDPKNITIFQGQQVRFIIKNEGLLEHEFILNTREENLKHAEEMKKNPEMEHDDPNAKRVAPRGTKEVLWQFTKPGKFHIGCLIPGHLEAGMEAFVEVVPTGAKAK